MKNASAVLLNFLVIVGILLSGCAQKHGGDAAKSIEGQASVEVLSIEEQKAKAYELFRQILYLSDSPEREKHLPEIKSLYREIIEKYPDSGLTQESYLRLVMLAKNEKTAEGDAEAARLYEEFSRKYPGSKLKRVIENELDKQPSDK